MAEIRELTEAEKACLGCTLPICSEESPECRYVQINRSLPKSIAQKKYWQTKQQSELQRTKWLSPESRAKTALANTKTHCVRGHEMTPENLNWNKSKGRMRRNCKMCTRIRNLARYHEKKSSDVRNVEIR